MHLNPLKGLYVNSADPDQTPHNVASDQGLHCLLTEFSITNKVKKRNRSDTPKMTIGLVQHYTVEESTSIQWVIVYCCHVVSYIDTNIFFLSFYKERSF